MRFNSESLSKLTECFYLAGQPDDTFSSLLEPVSFAMPDRIFARILRSEGITVQGNIGRPSSCGPTTLVDNIVRSPSVASRGCLLILARLGPHAARCTIEAGVM